MISLQTKLFSPVFTLQIMIREATHNRPISTYTLVNYLYDGKYVFQMRLHHSLEHNHLNVTLMYKRKMVSGAPIYLRKPIYSDACDCPTGNLTEWLERMGCPASYSQIDADFKTFPKINIKKIVSRFEEKIFRAGSVALCRYIIRDNKVSSNWLQLILRYKSIHYVVKWTISKANELWLLMTEHWDEVVASMVTEALIQMRAQIRIFRPDLTVE